MAIKHAFTSGKADGGDATLVRPIDWNAAHVGGDGPWEGIIHSTWGDGNPHDPLLWAFQNTVVSVAGPTPTGITASIGRLRAFRFKTAISPIRVRWFGVAAVNAIYTMAIYSGTTRLWTATITTAAATWGSATVAFTVPANTLCWFGLGANTTGTTSGFRSPASPIATSLGILTLPSMLNAYGLRYAQVALTAGAWPDPLPTLAAAAFASAGATGTLPIVFLDTSAT